MTDSDISYDGHIIDDRDRSEIFADYIIKNCCTVRSAAHFFGMSKSTVHKDVAKKLRDINFAKYIAVCEVLATNKSERHLRGGMATKMKYETIKGK